MTSDAKIGLLLGLVFIFIIAFVINGLPSFRGEKNGNELTHNMAMSRRGDTGIGAAERQYIGETRRIELPPPVLAPVGQAPIEVVRHEMLMPTVPAAVGGMSGETMPQTPAAAENEMPQSGEPEVTPQAPVSPKVHVVAVGDNLTRIAKKYYGAAEAEKPSSIERILRANRKILKSADRIYEGQKLVIPSLENSSESGLVGKLFEKVKNIGGAAVASQKSDKESETKPVRHYVVQEGDNLWKIAARQLGDGNRYVELSRLNKAVLEHEDNLTVGMRLRLPAN